MKKWKKVIVLLFSIMLLSSSVAVSAKEADSTVHKAPESVQIPRMVYGNVELAPGEMMTLNNPSGVPDYYLFMSKYLPLHVEMDCSEDFTYKMGFYSPEFGFLWNDFEFLSYNRSIDLQWTLPDGKYLIFFHNTSDKYITLYNIRTNY